MEALDRRFTTEEVAKMYHCTPTTVSRWVRGGRLTAINLGGNRSGPYVFRKKDLMAFERASEVGKSKEV